MKSWPTSPPKNRSKETKPTSKTKPEPEQMGYPSLRLFNSQSFLLYSSENKKERERTQEHNMLYQRERERERLWNRGYRLTGFTRVKECGFLCLECLNSAGLQREKEWERRRENQKIENRSRFSVEKEKKESNVIYSHLESSSHMIQVFKII